MPKYEYKCSNGHMTTISQKYSQGKPPARLDVCDGSIEGHAPDNPGQPCPERPKRHYGPVAFVVR